jgi:hypothetical protein
MMNKHLRKPAFKIGAARSVPPVRLAFYLHLCRPPIRERLSNISGEVDAKCARSARSAIDR